MGRSNLFRIAATAVLIAAIITAIVAIHQHPAKPVMDALPAAALGPDDLSAELRRCRALSPKDGEDPHCMAVWEESRRRFFGKPARPLLPPGTAAPVPGQSGDAP